MLQISAGRNLLLEKSGGMTYIPQYVFVQFLCNGIKKKKKDTKQLHPDKTDKLCGFESRLSALTNWIAVKLNENYLVTHLLYVHAQLMFWSNIMSKFPTTFFLQVLLRFQIKLSWLRRWTSFFYYLLILTYTLLCWSWKLHHRFILMISYQTARKQPNSNVLHSYWRSWTKWKVLIFLPQTLI